MATTDYVLGLDLGQASDYTAIAVLEALAVPTGATREVVSERAIYPPGPGDGPRRFLEWDALTGGADVDKHVIRRATTVAESAPQLHLRLLERVRDQPYPAIVARVAALLAAPPLAGKTALVVDATGVGRPVVDLLRAARLAPIAVTITGGDAEGHDGAGYRVPKRDLVSALQVALQGGELKIARELPLAATLRGELLAFKVRISLKTAHDSYGEWREGQHDDLVLATALAAWWARRPRQRWGAA